MPSLPFIALRDNNPLSLEVPVCEVCEDSIVQVEVPGISLCIACFQAGAEMGAI
jgi:hypothetical protein